jgi:hypothetical protein
LEAVVSHGVPDELVEQVAKALFEQGLSGTALGMPDIPWSELFADEQETPYRDQARAAIGAVCAYQAEHGAQSDAMNADWWVEPPRDGEA